MNTTLLFMVALVGGEIHTGTGDVIPNGTLVIKNGEIVAIGTEVSVPAEAKIIDAKGDIVTPGLVDAYTALGLVEIGGVGHSNDADSGFKSPVRAAQRAVDSLNLHSAVIPVQKAHGITTVLSVPRGGLVSGQAALFNLIPNGLIESHAAMARMKAVEVLDSYASVRSSMTLGPTLLTRTPLWRIECESSVLRLSILKLWVESSVVKCHSWFGSIGALISMPSCV